MKRWISVMGLVGMMSVGGALSGCDAGTTGGAPVAVAIGDLDGLVSSASARLELTIAAGGAVKTIAASRELGHDEHVEGQVVAIDAAARTLELADVGTVRWTAGSRLRTREESRAAEQAWVAEVAGGLARGESVRVRADRAVTSPVAAPTATEFAANDLRIESPRAGAKLEIVVTAAHLSDDGATLVFLGRSHDLGGATLRVSDDMARELEVGDDHGGHGEAEPGDDNGGGGEFEPGDDNGGGGEFEPGDDNGGGGEFEPGDDNGGGGEFEAEPGDDNGGGGEFEPGDDNGGGAEFEAEPGDDNGGGAEAEPGDDNGGGGHGRHGGEDD